MNISFINPEQMLYSQIQIQIHPSPFQWMLPLLCYVIQLLHHELREDQFASILQVGVLTLSGVPCPFSSRNSVIWNTVLETVQERASLIRKYFIKDLISPNHINEPCYMLYIWLPAVPHVTVIGQTTLVVPKERSLRPVKMDFWNYMITRSWKSSCWSPNVEEDRLETRPELSLCSRLDYRIGCTWWASTQHTCLHLHSHTYTHTHRESVGSSHLYMLCLFISYQLHPPACESKADLRVPGLMEEVWPRIHSCVLGRNLELWVAVEICNN